MDKISHIGFAIICLFLESVSTSGPFFVDSDNNVVATQGQSTILPCNITNMTDTYQVTWKDPNGEILTSGKTVLKTDNRLSLQAGWDLRIANVNHSDSGIYICEISTVPPLENNVSLIVLSSNESTTIEPTSEDPDRCSDSRPCQNGGICDAGVCNCSSGFTGASCEMPTVCPPGACNINNTKNCTVLMKHDGPTYQCDCYPFYKGTQCKIYDYCEFFPCENRGRCRLLHPQNGYACDCPIGDPNNDCKLNIPQNNCPARPPPSSEKSYITCIDKIDSYKMYCSPGYAGDKQGCKFANQDLQLFCNEKGQGYCTDEGFCKPLCNVDVCNGTQNCEFTANPYNTTGFVQKPDCIKAFGDGFDHPDCQGEETLFDGFDVRINNLIDCSPFFDTICTRDFGNGDCRPGCNNEDCLYDGFDCSDDNLTELAGVVIVELRDPLGVSLNDVQRSMSLMMRSVVNLTEETYNPYESITLLELKVSDTDFTDIEYVGKFLAAAVAKRPEWLEGVKITDVYACPAGKYSATYSDKCQTSCGGCIQDGDICNWKTGECIHAHGCERAHWGARCEPCATSCVQEGDVCGYSQGECIAGCKPGHYGDKCLPCKITCKNEGDTCNNKTGECLHGCISNLFYGPMCRQCPGNCVGGCNETGYCNNCISGWHGETCKKACDQYCQYDTCDKSTGNCVCELGYFWDTSTNWCEICSSGCTSDCDVTSGACGCRDGYYGSRCDFHCKDTCLNGSCYVNGTCDLGCDMGFYGPLCTKACPVGCYECSREAGVCDGGNCKPGYEGSTCQKKARKSSYPGDVTDNTGVIIGVIISLLLVVLILVVACCYWRKRQSGDYVMEDEEMEEPVAKDSKTVQVHTNMHMQPTSPLLGHSMDMIELDEKQHTVVYAGPGHGQTADTADDAPNDNVPTDKEPEGEKVEPANDNMDNTADDIDEPGGKKNERCMSSVTMEIGSGGRVLSVSDGDEAHSPTINKEVELIIGEEAESTEGADDSAFADPPHSPLGEVRAPLASEENILATLGPKEIQFSNEDEPAALDHEKEESNEEDKKSQKSRSSSSSSSSSNSSKGSKSSKGSNQEITTEM